VAVANPPLIQLQQVCAWWAIQEKEKKLGVCIVAVCPGFNTTALNYYMGMIQPEDGVRVIVEAALAKKGKSGVFFDKGAIAVIFRIKYTAVAK
jgi:hypothetical protein